MKEEEFDRAVVSRCAKKADDAMLVFVVVF